MQPKDLMKDLPPLARLLYRELCAFYKKKGSCFATNAYFAKKYMVSARTITRNLSILEEKHLIFMRQVPYQLKFHYREITPILADVEEQRRAKQNATTDEEFEKMKELLGRTPSPTPVFDNRSAKARSLKEQLKADPTDGLADLLKRALAP